MVQQLDIPQDLLKDFDHYAVRFPTRNTDRVPAKLLTRSASRPPSAMPPTADGGKVVRAGR
jgi:hypothetical protein